MLRKAGTTRSAVWDIVSELRPTPGAEALVHDLQVGGAKVVVISGGIRCVIDAVFPRVHFDAVHINRLIFGEDGRLRGGEATPYDREHKVEGLEALAKRFGVAIERTAFVGDGPNDIAVARRAKLSVAWAKADPGLIAVADEHVDAVHLDALRPLLFGAVEPAFKPKK